MDGKVGNRGITMVFVGYADGHAGNCYRMYNPVTLRSQVCVSCDIVWMGTCTLPLRTVTKQSYCQSLQSQLQMMMKT